MHVLFFCQLVTQDMTVFVQIAMWPQTVVFITSFMCIKAIFCFYCSCRMKVPQLCAFRHLQFFLIVVHTLEGIIYIFYITDAESVCVVFCAGH